jgi:hypothetical protein
MKTPRPNQIKHLSDKDLDILEIKMTDSQEHDDASQIVLKPSVVQKKPKLDVYNADADINAMIALFLCLVGIIVVLSTFLGSLVLWDRINNKDDGTPCIEIFIGDGLCDDRQNVPECNYDGQDCCLAGHLNSSFCEDCACHLGMCSSVGPPLPPPWNK